ncbi:hypothetical protein [Clostridium sp.]|nr:hypothetical protein [uncultured Clostridium sp.]
MKDTRIATKTVPVFVRCQVPFKNWKCSERFLFKLQKNNQMV